VLPIFPVCFRAAFYIAHKSMANSFRIFGRKISMRPTRAFVVVSLTLTTQQPLACCAIVDDALCRAPPSLSPLREPHQPALNLNPSSPTWAQSGSVPSFAIRPSLPPTTMPTTTTMKMPMIVLLFPRDEEQRKDTDSLNSHARKMPLLPPKN